MDAQTLQARIRSLLAAGRLPRELPTVITGGRGSGRACMICDATINATETEIEFDGDVVHGRCFYAWRSHMMRQERTPPSGGPPATRQ